MAFVKARFCCFTSLVLPGSHPMEIVNLHITEAVDVLSMPLICMVIGGDVSGCKPRWIVTPRAKRDASGRYLEHRKLKDTKADTVRGAQGSSTWSAAEHGGKTCLRETGDCAGEQWKTRPVLQVEQDSLSGTLDWIWALGLWMPHLVAPSLHHLTHYKWVLRL